MNRIVMNSKNKQGRKDEMEGARQTIRFFETLLRASTDGIVITDVTQSIIIVNEAFCSFFGVRFRDVAETNLMVWLEQIDGDALQRWADLEKEIHHEGECHDVEFKLISKQEDKWLSVNASFLERIAGEEKGVIISTWRDITGRKQKDSALAKYRYHLEEVVEQRTVELQEKIVEQKLTEKRLQESERKFRILYDDSPDMYVSVSPEDAIVLLCNKTLLEETGYSKEEIIGFPLLKIYHENCLEKVKKLFQQFTETGVIEDQELILKRKDGSKIIVSLNADAVKDEAGRILHSISSLRDITKRKQAEDALRESEKRLNTLLNATTNIAFLAESDGTFLSVNNALAKSLNKDKEELINNSMFDFVSREDAKKRKLILQKIVKSKKPFQWKDDRAGRYFDNSVYPILDDKGNVKQIATFARDITAQVKSDETLHQYEQIISATNDHMSFLDRDYTYLAVNDAYLITHKKERLQIIGHTVADTLGDDIFEQFVKEKLDRCLAGEEIHYQDWFDFPGQDQRYMDVAYYPHTGSDGLISGVVVSSHDITERKLAEDALRESEEKYRSMMESMKNGSYICSPELHIEYMNPAMIDRVGTDATGEICYKAIYDRDEQCSWCVFDQIKKGEHIDYEVIDPKDNYYYSVTNSPIFHSNGTVSKLTIFHDITEIKKIEADLQQSRKMESIGTLTGGIAHDFNNLLYMISGNTELALEDIPDWNPVHQNLQEIKSAGLKAAGIVKQLLHFSRKTDQKLKPIGAVTAIKDSLKFLRSTIPSTIEIKTQLPDDEIAILADPIQINQIMMNLCINASHAMEETGGILEIKIETASLDKETVNSYPDLTITNNYLKITLSDTGPGIPPEIINQIFDPYFTTKEFGKGSGMGLTVVQGIVKNHDGAITVDSQVGKGTAFTILFPVIDEAPEIINKKTGAIPHGTENILFVDDEKAITNMMQQILEKLGYHVEAKLNPEEALDLFQAKPDSFDIVITDMTMPQMTGAKFAEKLKEIRSDIPIILCTGHSSLIDGDKARQSGISGYVMKPVSMSKIAKAIREALDR